MRLGQSAACAMVLGVLGIITPAQLNAAQDSVINGNFSAGSGNAPDGWRTESWVHEPTTSYAWVGPRNGEAGEVEVSNLEPNDGRWTQSLVLDPGTYFVSAEIRTEGVSRSAGAFISLADEGIASFDITGDSYWQRVGFYLYVSGRPAKVDVKLRLGGYKYLSTGRAYFRNVEILKIDRPPPGASFFDIQQIRGRWRGSSASLVLLLVVLAATTFVGWRLFSGLQVIPTSSGTGPGTSRSRRAHSWRA